MYLAHYGIGMAAKKAAPQVSLGTFFLAAQFADILWPVFLLLGVERARVVPGITRVVPFDFVSYPWSHSLLALVVWGGVFWVAYRFVAGGKNRAGLMLGLVVFSHWVLDWISHRPDMPFYPGGEWVSGLGLWDSLPATLIVEAVVFAGGIWLYLRATRAKDTTGTAAFWALMVVLVAIYLGSVFGPPPRQVDNALAIVGLGGMVLVVLWGYWIDAHREPARTSRWGAARPGAGEPMYRGSMHNPQPNRWRTSA